MSNIAEKMLDDVMAKSQVANGGKTATKRPKGKIASPDAEDETAPVAGESTEDRMKKIIKDQDTLSNMFRG